MVHSFVRSLDNSNTKALSHSHTHHHHHHQNQCHYVGSVGSVGTHVLLSLLHATVHAARAPVMRLELQLKSTDTNRGNLYIQAQTLTYAHK